MRSHFKIMAPDLDPISIPNNYIDFTKVATSNSGNLIFNFALDVILGSKLERVRWNYRPSKEVSKIIIPMANNIGSHMDLEKSGPKIPSGDIKITIFGLGAQSSSDTDRICVKTIPTGTVNWLHSVCNGSDIPNISVRDELTKKFFEDIGLSKNVIVLGCPSHFINPNKTLGATIYEKAKRLSTNTLKDISVLAGHDQWNHLAKLERFSIDSLNRFGGNYIIQQSKDLIESSFGWNLNGKHEFISTLAKKWFNDAEPSEVEAWFKKNSKVFVSVQQWILENQKYQFGFGVRIHGVQALLQAGTPAVCLYVDSRTKGLCDTMHIPAINALDFQKSPDIEILINKVCSWDWKEYDNRRITLAKQTVEFMQNNNLPISNHLLALSH